MAVHALAAMLAASSSKSSSSSANPTLLIFVAIAAAFYFFIYRPQQRKAKAAREQSNKFEVGDEVLTAGGLVGHVIDIDGERITLETSVGASFVVLKQYVVRKLEPAETEAGDEAIGDEEYEDYEDYYDDDEVHDENPPRDTEVDAGDDHEEHEGADEPDEHADQDGRDVTSEQAADDPDHDGIADDNGTGPRRAGASGRRRRRNRSAPEPTDGDDAALG
jgi:preprotein translocase subunit YajC